MKHTLMNRPEGVGTGHGRKKRTVNIPNVNSNPIPQLYYIIQPQQPPTHHPPLLIQPHPTLSLPYPSLFPNTQSDARTNVIQFLQQLSPQMRSQIEQFIDAEIRTMVATKTRKIRAKVSRSVDAIQTKLRATEIENERNEDTIDRLRDELLRAENKKIYFIEKYDKLRDKRDQLYEKCRKYKRQCRELKWELDRERNRSRSVTPQTLTPNLSQSSYQNVRLQIENGANDDSPPIANEDLLHLPHGHPSISLPHSCATATRTHTHIQNSESDSLYQFLSTADHTPNASFIDLRTAAPKRPPIPIITNDTLNEVSGDGGTAAPSVDSSYYDTPVKRQSKLDDVLIALDELRNISAYDSDTPPIAVPHQPTIHSLRLSNATSSVLSSTSTVASVPFFNRRVTPANELEKGACDMMKIISASQPPPLSMDQNDISAILTQASHFTSTIQTVHIAIDFQLSIAFPPKCELSQFDVTRKMDISLPSASYIWQLKKRIAEMSGGLEDFMRLLLRMYTYDRSLTKSFGHHSNHRLTEYRDITDDNQTLEQYHIRDWDTIRVRLAAIEGIRRETQPNTPRQ